MVGSASGRPDPVADCYDDRASTNELTIHWHREKLCSTRNRSAMAEQGQAPNLSICMIIVWPECWVNKPAASG